MANDRHQGPAKDAGPVPRDLPDQQTHVAGEDPWDLPAGEPGDPATEDVPDTDEAGTGPDGAPRSASAHPEQPVPDEPSA
jgi:hypothetical protein